MDKEVNRQNVQEDEDKSVGPDIESPYSETRPTVDETVTKVESSKKRKPRYLPLLIIIPVLFLMAALGAVYWQMTRMATGNGEEPIGEEVEETDEENEETEDEAEVENVDIDLEQISDSLREIDDAIYDIDATFQLIDESLAKNDDAPEL